MNWYLVVYILSVIIVYFTLRDQNKDEIKRRYRGITVGDFIIMLMMIFSPIFNTVLAVVGLVMGIVTLFKAINKDSRIAKRIVLKMFFLKENEE